MKGRVLEHKAMEASLLGAADNKVKEPLEEIETLRVRAEVLSSSVANLNVQDFIYLKKVTLTVPLSNINTL